MSFENWKRRLAGEKITAYLQPQMEDEGYYRRPITEKVIGANGHRNGQNRIVGWEPVAYFIDGGKLCGVIGDRDMAANEVQDETLWSYVCRHPITEAVYRAVAERGEPWPDPSPAAAFNKDMAAPVAEAVIGHNTNTAPPVEPHVEHGEAIKNAISAAKDMEVKDEASAAVVLGMKNRIAELRLAATKTGKAIYAPIYQQYKTIMGQWTPMIESAENWEKVLDKRYLTWRAAEKKKADEAARIAAEAQRILEEQNARAADRAIARGEPEPEPERSEDELAAVPPAPLVTPTYRAAGQRTAPKEVERWHLDAIDDFDKLYEFFKESPAVRAALSKLATDAVKNGQEVPGTRRHFGLI
jgi:hypothetical protein